MAGYVELDSLLLALRSINKTGMECRQLQVRGQHSFQETGQVAFPTLIWPRGSARTFPYIGSTSGRGYQGNMLNQSIRKPGNATSPTTCKFPGGTGVWDALCSCISTPGRLFAPRNNGPGPQMYLGNQWKLRVYIPLRIWASVTFILSGLNQATSVDINLLTWLLLLFFGNCN